MAVYKEEKTGTWRAVYRYTCLLYTYDGEFPFVGNRQERGTLLGMADKGKVEAAARRNRVGVERDCRRQKSPRQGATAAFDGRNGCRKCFTLLLAKVTKPPPQR